MTISIFDYRDFLKGYLFGPAECDASSLKRTRENSGICSLFYAWLAGRGRETGWTVFDFLDTRFAAHGLTPCAYPFGLPERSGSHMLPARRKFAEAEYEWARGQAALAEFILIPFMQADPTALNTGLCNGFEPKVNSGQHFEYMYAQAALKESIAAYVGQGAPESEYLYPFGGAGRYHADRMMCGMRQNLMRIAFVEGELHRLGVAL